MSGPATVRSGRTPGPERARLRRAVLRLGARLGQRPPEVIAFGEAVAGRPWRSCGPHELALVLGEYAVLVGTLAGKAAPGESPA